MPEGGLDPHAAFAAADFKSLDVLRRMSETPDFRGFSFCLAFDR